MTEQVDFRCGFTGRASAAVASGISGTAGLSGVSDFATVLESVRFDRRAAARRRPVNHIETLVLRYRDAPRRGTRETMIRISTGSQVPADG